MAEAARAGDRPPPVDAAPSTEDDVRALIALAALGGPDRLAHEERLALGRALESSPALRAELRALAAVAAALPRPAPARAAAGPRPTAIPEALLRPDVVAALAALLLVLGLLRVVAGGSVPDATVATATVASVAGTTAVTEHPWGVEVEVELDGTAPGAVYEVTLTDADGARTRVGSFLGHEDTVRFVATAGVTRDDVRRVQVSDDAGEVVLRADLD